MKVADGGQLVDLLMEKCGVSRLTLGEWEAGKRGDGKKGVVVNGVLPEISGSSEERGAMVEDAGMFISLYHLRLSLMRQM